MVVSPMWAKPEARRRGRRAKRAADVAAPDAGLAGRDGTSVAGSEEVGDGDRLVAVWAGTTRSNPSAEDAAVRAALVAEVAGLAG